MCDFILQKSHISFILATRIRFRCHLLRLGETMPGCVHVIDDDASFRAAIERRLKHAGYEVQTYASSEQFMDRFPTDSAPGCILLDVQIPRMSGPELQVRLRKLGSTLPIIFMTGYPDIRTTVRVIKAGAEDFLTKPVSSDRLLEVVRACCRKTQFQLSPEGGAGRNALSVSDIDAARAGSLRTRHSRQYQQADRLRLGLYRTHHQGPSSASDA